MTIPSTYKRNTVGGAFTAQKIGKPIDTAATVEALAATGTFAYDQVAFILRGNQTSNTINGSASTALR
jgi:hypothetical protein